MTTQSDTKPIPQNQESGESAYTTQSGPNVTVIKNAPLPPGFHDMFKGFPFVNTTSPGNVTVTNIHTSGNQQPFNNKAEPTGKTTVVGPQHPAFPSDFHKIFERAFPNGESGTRTQVIEGMNRKKQVNNKFRIRDSEIKCLAAGTTGPVNMKSTSTTYKDNAEKMNVTAEGGSMVQPTFGGKANYTNKDTALTAADGGTGPRAGRRSGKFTRVEGHPFSPEQYLVKVLETGVTAQHLALLLESDYSVEQLAYSLPSAKSKRDRMIGTLLDMAKMKDD